MKDKIAREQINYLLERTMKLEKKWRCYVSLNGFPVNEHNEYDVCDLLAEIGRLEGEIKRIHNYLDVEVVDMPSKIKLQKRRRINENEDNG